MLIFYLILYDAIWFAHVFSTLCRWLAGLHKVHGFQHWVYSPGFSWSTIFFHDMFVDNFYARKQLKLLTLLVTCQPQPLTIHSWGWQTIAAPRSSAIHGLSVPWYLDRAVFDMEFAHENVFFWGALDPYLIGICLFMNIHLFWTGN